MRIVEIFSSIDGEGIRTGLPTTFIRVFGCNLRCTYCDTKYSYQYDKETDAYTTMSVSEIMERVRELGPRSITLTGGEPLVHEGVKQLVEELINEGFWVNVETNGTVDVAAFRKSLVLKQTHYGKLFFTIDYKAPSSGMNDKMDLANFRDLTKDDVLKFVVGCTADLDVAVGVLDELRTPANVFISPIFGAIEPAELVEYVLKHRLYGCKVQVQLHKIIWPPEQRGV